MKTLRRAACILLAAASQLASPAYSTSFSTDQSDLYYIQAESGWGIQLVQRGSVIFATMFVYGPGNTPTWYVATMQYVGNLTWSGDLYATTGPYFGTVPFNPANVVATKVGTMTWLAQTIVTGMLTYDVNGVGVVKNVVRQTLVYDDFSGHYAGAHHEDFTGGCTSGTKEAFDLFYVTQTGATLSLVAASPTVAGSCTYTGMLSQAGQMGTIQGSFACTDGSAGTFSFDEVQVNISGLTARLAFSYSSPPGCQATGWFGGMRATTF